MKNKQNKFNCKHIECDMDGCYCGLGFGEGYNHCVIPYYKESCEHFEEKHNYKNNKKRKFLTYKIDLEKSDKVAIVIFNKDGTTECGYHNMDLKDKALAKHEIEIDIIDNIIKVNKDRYFGENEEND